MAYRPPGVPSCRRFLDQPDCIRNIHTVNGRGYTVPGTHWSTLRHCSQLVPGIYMCPWFSKLLIVSAETAWFDKLFRIGIARGTHVSLVLSLVCLSAERFNCNLSISYSWTFQLDACRVTMEFRGVNSLHLYKAMSTIHITYAHSTLTPLHVCMTSVPLIQFCRVLFSSFGYAATTNHKHRDKYWRLHVRKGVWRIALVWYGIPQ